MGRWIHRFQCPDEPGPASHISASSKTSSDERTVLDMVPKQQKGIVSVAQWDAAFSTFMTVYTEKYPEQMADLLQYRQQIKKLAHMMKTLERTGLFIFNHGAAQCMMSGCLRHRQSLLPHQSLNRTVNKHRKQTSPFAKTSIVNGCASSLMMVYSAVKTANIHMIVVNKEDHARTCNAIWECRTTQTYPTTAQAWCQPPWTPSCSANKWQEVSYPPQLVTFLRSGLTAGFSIGCYTKPTRKISANLPFI